MILIKMVPNFFLLLLIIFLNSCESFKSVMGLSKPVFEDSVANETPDLILPPDFDAAPINKTTNSYSSQSVAVDEYNYLDENINQKLKNQVIPKARNFLAPKVIGPSASSPSDSIEKFKSKPRFTVGEWIYSQSVNDFRTGNIYYRPIYDKGYNFTRRYIPKNSSNDLSNVGNFGQNNTQNYSFDDEYQLQSDEKVISETGELPIID